MEAVRRAVATILSTFTGLYEGDLDAHSPFISLLEAAGNPPEAKTERCEQFGLLHYHYYWLDGVPRLDVYMVWSIVSMKLSKLPGDPWVPSPARSSRPIAAFDFSQLVSSSQTQPKREELD